MGQTRGKLPQRIEPLRAPHVIEILLQLAIDFFQLASGSLQRLFLPSFPGSEHAGNYTGHNKVSELSQL
jgi:hypothetical protein